MKSVRVFLAALSVVFLPSCQNGNTESDASTFDFEDASEVITARTKQFTESHITGDLEFLDNVFTEDARAYPPGSDKIATQADISAVNAQYVNEYGVSEFTEVSTNRYGGPDFVVDEGTYTMTYGPDNTSEAGHYINIWKRVDDDWKLFANMWTVMPEETD
ncbi:MAG: nuclear transport factor 2 family protein [Rhodothermales bacterium]|nr:nuclear transport factor 2 family protein [Rhodothermales bacterium]